MSQAALSRAIPFFLKGYMVYGFHMKQLTGAIDCTHIAIKAPSEGEYVYVNRKHFHSLNVQIICDAQMCLTNIVRWPGSIHD